MWEKIDIVEDKDYARARSVDLQSTTEISNQFNCFRFLINFFFTTVIRAKERKVLPSYIGIIRNALTKDVALSLWLVETFCQYNLIKELLIDCPLADMKRFVSGLLKTAMITVYEHEE